MFNEHLLHIIREKQSARQYSTIGIVQIPGYFDEGHGGMVQSYNQVNNQFHNRHTSLTFFSLIPYCIILRVEILGPEYMAIWEGLYIWSKGMRHRKAYRRFSWLGSWRHRSIARKETLHPVIKPHQLNIIF